MNFQLSVKLHLEKCSVRDKEQQKKIKIARNEFSALSKVAFREVFC